MAIHALLSQIVIDSTNKWLDINTGGGGDESVSITEQTYDSVIDVTAAFQVVLRALGGDVALVNLSLFHDSGSTPGRVRFTNGATPLTVEWKTGAHGSDNLDTHAGDVLGFSDAADDSMASFAIISDYQHLHGWYAPHGPAADSYDMPVVLGPAPVVAASGIVRRVTNPNDLDERIMRWEMIYKDKFLPDDSATNEAFADWWRWAARGYAFGYYTDVENETLSGTYALITPVDRLAGVAPRESAGDAYFSFDMTWQKDPS